MKEIEKEGIHYILGVRMRRNLEVTLEGGTWVEVYGPRQRQKDPSPLLVKEKTVNLTTITTSKFTQQP